MSNASLDKSWHLAENILEIQVTEFELLLWRVFHSFLRWQEDCESYINHIELTGQELAVLHVVRMKDRPKTLYDISRLMNRDDFSNVQYSIRKLLKLGLVRKSKGGSKTVAYEITEKGIEDTNAYSVARKSILIDIFNKESGLQLEETTQTLAKLKGIYDEAGRIAASYKTTNLKKKT